MEWPLLFLKLGGGQVLGRHLTQESHAPEAAAIESRQARWQHMPRGAASLFPARPLTPGVSVKVGGAQRQGRVGG